MNEELLTGRQVFAKLSEEDVFLDDFEIYRNDSLNKENPSWERMYTSCEIEFILKTPLLFRYVPKQHFIEINGIKVPAPFEPKIGETYYYPSPYQTCGYDKSTYRSNINDDKYLGMWRIEDEIKQVVEALRSLFNEVLK